MKYKKIGIAAHSYEGGALCFLTACREGASLLGAHMHPNIILSAIPMGLSMSAWEANDYQEIQKHLEEGLNKLQGAELIFLFVRTIPHTLCWKRSYSNCLSPDFILPM